MSEHKSTTRDAGTSGSGCSTFSFRHRNKNAGPESLASGIKLCENDGCDQTAQHIAEDADAIYYVCDRCVGLIPNVTVLKSNRGADLRADDVGTKPVAGGA